MAESGPRIRRERRTVAAMIRLYCRQKHGRREAICENCQAIHDYAMARLERCPFQDGKPTCA